ncbi:hypothetical protein [Halomonas salina]|uniref:hypothetical protein n=1 Tax=Halomonas salina TaxID=42565 RepID=UPI0012698613|nr:hypothetical protein [Halomonas salina]
MQVERWEEYKSFFQITVFRYFVLWFSLVPLVANFLSDLSGPIDVTINDKIYTLNMSLPFNWQLLWISSLFFVVALAIYHCRCPKFIKKYNTYSDYASYSHDPRWIAWEASFMLKDASEKQVDKFVQRLSKKKFLCEVADNEFVESEVPVVEESQTIYYFRHKGLKYKLGMPIYINEAIPEGSEKGVFFEIFGRLSESRRCARSCIKILLLLSFTLFVVVILQHIWSGGVLVFEWIKGLIS